MEVQPRTKDEKAKLHLQRLIEESILYDTEISVAEIAALCAKDKSVTDFVLKNNLWKVLFEKRFPDKAHRAEAERLADQIVNHGKRFHVHKNDKMYALTWQEKDKFYMEKSSPSSQQEFETVLEKFIDPILGRVSGNDYDWPTAHPYLIAMVLYNFLADGWTFEQQGDNPFEFYDSNNEEDSLHTDSVNCSICQTVRAVSKCSACEQAICGEKCFEDVTHLCVGFI